MLAIEIETFTLMHNAHVLNAKCVQIAKPVSHLRCLAVVCSEDDTYAAAIFDTITDAMRKVENEAKLHVRSKQERKEIETGL